MTPEQKDVIRYRLERAAEALDEARLLLDKGFLNTCVNRLYYTCFFAVSALLLIGSAVYGSFQHHLVIGGGVVNPATARAWYALLH